VETLLVTGDNVLTSIRVAKMSKIVDETEQLVYGELLDNEAIDWKDIDVQY
jgi:cation-transporting ATPase 13A3/4/5